MAPWMLNIVIISSLPATSSTTSVWISPGGS